MIIRALEDASNFVKDRAVDAATVGKNVGYTFVCVTGKMSKEVGGTRSIVGLTSATISLLNIWIAVSEPFLKLGAQCELANKGLGALHIFQGFGEFAAGTANKSAFHLAGKISVTVKNVITFAQFLEGLAVISAGTCQGFFDKVTGQFGFVAQVKDVANGFEFVGYSFDFIHNATDLENAIRQNGFQTAFNWKRAFAISLDTAKLCAIGFSYAAGPVGQSVRFGALLCVSGVHIGRALHEHLTGQKA